MRGLLEERETAARVRAEELRVEADRVLAELREAEAVLEHRVIARMELAEALAAPAVAAEASMDESRPVSAEASAEAGTAPVAGWIVVIPRPRDGVITAVSGPCELTATLLDGLARAAESGGGVVELRQRFALPLLLGILGEFLGVDAEDRDRLHGMPNRAWQPISTRKRVIAAERELLALLGEIAAAKAE